MFKKDFNYLCLFIISTLMMSIASPAVAGNGDQGLRSWELGEKAFDAGRYPEAISHYKTSLSSCAADFECAAANSNGIGASYEAMGDDPQAFGYYQEALGAAKKSGNQDLIATNLFNVGVIASRAFHQYEKALSLLEESAQLFTKLNDEESLGIVLFNTGKVLNALGRYPKALAIFNASLRINERLRNQPALAGNLNLIGNTYAKLGENDTALSYYLKALGLNRKLNNPGEIATTLRNIGDAYCDLVQQDKAVDYYRDALRIQKEQNLRSAEAVTLTNLGALYYDLDQYDKAVAYYKESLNIGNAMNDPALIAVNLGNIGNVYGRLGESDKALSHYKQSLRLEQQLNRQSKVAVTYSNIGMEYFRLEQYERALDYLGRALKIDRTLNNPHTIALRLNNIGAVYLRQKRYADAEKVFLERKALGAKIEKTRLIQAGLIAVYLETGRYREALALLKNLPPSWRDNRKRHMEYDTQYGMALSGMGLLGESSREFLKAVSTVEEIRRSVTEKNSFFAGGGYISWLTPHRELTAVLSKMAVAGEKIDTEFQPYGRNPASAAFYFSEMTKARTLLEAMSASAQKSQGEALPPYLHDKEQAVLHQLAAADRQWEAAYRKGKEAVNGVEASRQSLRDELARLIQELRQEYPGYAALHYPRPIPPEELPLKANEVLLEYAMGEDAGFLFVVRKGGVSRLVKIPVSRQRLEETVTSFLAPMNSNEYEQFSIREGKALYDLLFSEAAKDIQPSEHIIIVPDGVLGSLPFEALVTSAGRDYRDTRYAGDTWTITYAQSATTLALTRMMKPPASQKPLFALGNPVYNKSDPRYAAARQGGSQTPVAEASSQYAYRGFSVVPKAGADEDDIKWEEVVYPPLPETEDEIRKIADRLGVNANPPDVLLDMLANETNLRNVALTNYRYIHFATHAGLAGEVRGIQEPFILLGQVENKGGDDGMLTLSEVLALPLDADMVVLSACSTGKGRVVAGEGVANFARAFQYAGSRSVVVSLWKVASRPAVEFMEAFYRRLKGGEGRARALKRAREEIRATYPNPFYWAVFVLYGEG